MVFAIAAASLGVSAGVLFAFRARRWRRANPELAVGMSTAGVARWMLGEWVDRETAKPPKQRDSDSSDSDQDLGDDGWTPSDSPAEPGGSSEP